MGISPLEYFRCRRERRQIGPVTSWLGEHVHSHAGDHQRTTGHSSASRWDRTCATWRRSGARGARSVCTTAWTSITFRPADADERARLRSRLDLPRDKFLIVLSSRISHEKDPETVLRAVALARARGLDAVLLNLGGGYREFLALPARLGIENAACWVLGAAGRAPDEGAGRLLSRRRRRGAGVARGGRRLLDARSAGLRDARRRHRGRRDGGPASRLRIADAASGREPRWPRRFLPIAASPPRRARRRSRARVRVPRMESREGVCRSGAVCSTPLRLPSDGPGGYPHETDVRAQSG